ncbi:cytochrome P450 [Carnobacterium sp.]|uniref:cytochrome P450 n=1 Tax=Carnobacterium sp. TaxID=48221 RepID=UPI0028A80BB9|nr:cytochrome P450 [Carnobacterium sp.]
MTIQPMPHEKGLDNTVHVLKEGYSYILNRRKKFQSDVFETHLLGQKAICMGGEAAAELFYDTSKFKRKDAAPKRVQKTLLGEKGVQTLDGKEHLHRKEMFMSLMSPTKLDKMNSMLKKHWEAAVEKWTEQEEIVLYHEAQKVLFRAACEWTGVPFEEKEVAELAADLGEMIETPTEIGPAHWMGRHDRNQTEKWIENLIEQVRDKKLSPPEGTALAVFSWHRDLEGNLLDTHTAAVEVLNIIRPIVAIAIYINFTALAVHEHSAAKEKLAGSDPKQLQAFVQEVRRFYPFFPFQGAVVKKILLGKAMNLKKVL